MKIAVTVDATYPDDLFDEDIEGLKEDIEDVARGFGGYGVVIGCAVER